jgi:uncharacterized NAD-dependent epimerase/dehydratase family protein
MIIPRPVLLFIGDASEPTFAKTAFGLRDWAGEHVVGQWRLAGAKVDLGLPELAPAAAVAAGAKSMVIGIAPVGGALPAHWVDAVCEALAAGLDIVSGLHTQLGATPAIAETARRHQRSLYDVRVPTRAYPVGTGHKRSGMRLLTVGTDCALGKKYTALAVTKAMRARGIAATFRATGQTGIMIAGAGVPLDAVVADFVSGAAETLSPEAAPNHWDIIEGQGSIFHAGYAGVTVGLVHGSQPDAMILCHDPQRRTIFDLPHIPIPPIDEAMRRYVELAQLTNRETRFVAISLNTSALAEPDARTLLRRVSGEHDLPAIDPIRFGADAAVDRLLSDFRRAA